MAILMIQTGVTGLSGTIPSFIYIQTTDTFATITSVGYLNNARQEGYNFSPNSLVLIDTTDVGPILLQIKIVGRNIVLVEYVPGVQIPTTINHIATYLNANGRLGQDASTAINNGNIEAVGNLVALGNVYAGAEGVAGTFISYPSVASRGTFEVEAAINNGDYNLILTNDALSQSSIFYLPDPLANDCTILTSDVGSANTQTIRTGSLQMVAGNFGITTGNITVGTGYIHVTSGNIIAQSGSIQSLAGNVVAGSSGHAGVLVSYSAAATNTFQIEASNNNVSSDIVLTHDAFYASSTVKIPSPESDPVCKILIGETDTPFIAGNIPVAKNTLGIMQDSGVPAANLNHLMLNATGINNANMHFGTTIVAGGSTDINYNTNGVTNTSTMILVPLQTTNNAYITDYYPGSQTSPTNYVPNWTLGVWNVDPGAHSVAWISIN